MFGLYNASVLMRERIMNDQSGPLGGESVLQHTIVNITDSLHYIAYFCQVSKQIYVSRQGFRTGPEIDEHLLLRICIHELTHAKDYIMSSGITPPITELSHYRAPYWLQKHEINARFSEALIPIFQKKLTVSEFHEVIQEQFHLVRLSADIPEVHSVGVDVLEYLYKRAAKQYCKFTLYYNISNTAH